jgi:hypothetical protein
MSIFKIQKFGCKDEIPDIEDLNYLKHYSSIHDCIVELEVRFKISFYNPTSQSIKEGYRHCIIEINDNVLISDIISDITKFKEECDITKKGTIPV